MENEVFLSLTQEVAGKVPKKRGVTWGCLL